MTTKRYTCSCGSDSHEDQRTRYPVNARVRTINLITCHLGTIPTGTTGKITSHCDDGRAWVFFDGYSAGHTFHFPEGAIEVVEQPSTEQPVSAVSEMLWKHNFTNGEYHIREVGNGDCIAHTKNFHRAEQVCREHNRHAILVAQREHALEALKTTAHNASDRSGLCWCAMDDRVFGHSGKCESIRAVLTTIEQEER